jgi:hypothetical protein
MLWGMGVTHHRNLLFGVLGLGAAALVVDRAVLQPSSAGAAATPLVTQEASASSERPAAPAPAGDGLPSASVPKLAGRIDALSPPQITPDIFKADPAEWGLPTPGRAGPPEVTLRLGAIMNADAAGQDASTSCAVINSRIVREGGTVAGFVVERITPTSVLLRRGSETRELRLAR